MVKKARISASRKARRNRKTRSTPAPEASQPEPKRRRRRRQRLGKGKLAAAHVLLAKLGVGAVVSAKMLRSELGVGSAMAARMLKKLEQSGSVARQSVRKAVVAAAALAGATSTSNGEVTPAKKRVAAKVSQNTESISGKLETLERLSKAFAGTSTAIVIDAVIADVKELNDLRQGVERSVADLRALLPFGGEDPTPAKK